MSIFQDIKTKVAGLPCKIRVMNKSGDDCLTTYDLVDVESVKVATDEFSAFMDSCIAEYRGLKADFKKSSGVFGRRPGQTDFDLIPFPEIEADGFSLDVWEEILIQPAPLAGG